MISPEELAALKAEHTPKEVPPCKVCGKALIFWCDSDHSLASDHGDPFDPDAPYERFVCPDWRKDIKSTWPTDEECKHQRASVFERPKRDPRVLRLIEAYEHEVAESKRRWEEDHPFSSEGRT